MKELQAELWDLHKKGGWACITTNGTVRTNGELAMGGGCAKEARDRFPLIPLLFGMHVLKEGNHCQIFKNERLILFPTKENYWNFSTIELVERSCLELMVLIDKYKLSDVYLPQPGCGLGGLDWKYVKPVIEKILDDRVTVVSYKT